MNLAVALMLLAQASAPGPENWAYLMCMTGSAGEYLATKPSKAEYIRHLRSACRNQRAALRREVIRRQLVGGRSKSEADRDAEEFFAILETQMLDLQP